MGLRFDPSSTKETNNLMDMFGDLAIDEIKSGVKAKKVKDVIGSLTEEGGDLTGAGIYISGYDSDGNPKISVMSPKDKLQYEDLKTQKDQPSIFDKKKGMLPLNVEEPSPSQVNLTGEAEIGDIVPKGYDVSGRPTGYERKEKSAAQEKRDVEIKELSGQVTNLIQLYQMARKEADAVPGVGQRGVSGRLAGKTAILKGKVGHSPAVNAFQDKIPAFATIVAKAAGEVRPTDRDIERFMGTLMTLDKNDEENAIIMQQLLQDLEAKGAGAVWSERTGKKQKKPSLVPQADQTQYSPEQDQAYQQYLKDVEESY